MLVAELRFPYSGLIGKKGMYRMYIFRECLILGGLGGLEPCLSQEQRPTRSARSREYSNIQGQGC